MFVNPPEEGEIARQAILPNPMVVSRADDPLVRERNIPLSRLADEPLLMREPARERHGGARLFARHGLAPRIRMELSSSEAIRQAILAGLASRSFAPYLRTDTGQRNWQS